MLVVGVIGMFRSDVHIRCAALDFLKEKNDMVLDTLENKQSRRHVSHSVLSASATCTLHAVAEFLRPSDREAMGHFSTHCSAETWWKKQTESEPVRSRATHYAEGQV